MKMRKYTPFQFFKLSNANKGIRLLLKYLFSLAAIAYIPYKIAQQFATHEHSALSSMFSPVASMHANLTNNWQLFFLVASLFVLMVLNWLIETYKWYSIVLSFQAIPFVTAIKAVLSGVAFSLFTPNRSAEIVGRLQGIADANKAKALLYSGVGNLSQLLMTCIFGLLSWVLIAVFPQTFNFHLPRYLSLLPVIVLAALTLVGLVLLYSYYFTIVNYLILHSQKVPFFKRLSAFLSSSTQMPDQVPSNLMLKLLLLSASRYAVFAIQYDLMLLLMNVQVTFFTAMVLIPFVFLAVTAIPTFALTEIGVRASLAISIIGTVSSNSTGIALASLALWVLNLGLPALVGALWTNIESWRFLKFLMQKSKPLQP